MLGRGDGFRVGGITCVDEIGNWGDFCGECDMWRGSG